jgi:hypothetical protein
MPKRDSTMVLLLSETQSSLLWPTVASSIVRARRRHRKRRLLQLSLGLLVVVILVALSRQSGLPDLIGRIGPWAGFPP